MRQLKTHPARSLGWVSDAFRRGLLREAHPHTHTGPQQQQRHIVPRAVAELERVVMDVSIKYHTAPVLPAGSRFAPLAVIQTIRPRLFACQPGFVLTQCERSTYAGRARGIFVQAPFLLQCVRFSCRDTGDFNRAASRMLHIRIRLALGGGYASVKSLYLRRKFAVAKLGNPSYSEQASGEGSTGLKSPFQKHKRFTSVFY